MILVGGVPLTLEIAEQYGADGYADSAGTAVDAATKLIKKQQFSVNDIEIFENHEKRDTLFFVISYI